MSSSLYWSPAREDRNILPDSLKYILRKKYGDPVNAVMNYNDIAYLDWLIDAGLSSASQLKAIIENHEEVVVKEIF